MIQHLCKTTAKLWHNVLAGAILTVRALWLLRVMRMDRASIHNHSCVPSGLKHQLVAQSSPSLTAGASQSREQRVVKLHHKPLLATRSTGSDRAPSTLLLSKGEAGLDGGQYVK